MPDMNNLALATLIGPVLLFLWNYLSKNGKSKSRKAPYPPGPKPDWIIGNLRHFPAMNDQPWIKTTELQKEYGDIIHMEVLGTHVVFLNSFEAANELLNKRNYNGRPKAVLTGELIGWEQLILFNNYGERWRRQRKFTHAHFNKVAAKQHWPLHEAQTIYFLKKLLQTPEAFRSDFRLTAGRGILMTTYGIKVESAKDRFIVVPEEVMANLILPGAYLVDSFPILKHLPEWFPGAGFQKIAKSVGAALREMAESPFERVKKDMAAGVAVPSMTSNLLENILGDEEAEDNLKTAAGTMYAGGSDTTVSAMMSFLIAMLRYPSILRKAQAEIDQVIGDHRLPTLDDREHLPYVNAVIKEVLRWYPVSSMSAPHLPLEDDIYEGYLIPKGATVLPCQWAMSRDTRHYPDPEEFIPERFLKIDEKTGKPPLDPVLYAFGFGRRICPGIHFAEASLFLHISCVLATFNIERAVDENGKEKLPVPGHVGEGAVMNHPEFECRITPRSANAVSLIESAALA